MPATKLKEFLDSHGVKYVSFRHSPAFTAAAVAASAHLARRDFAKTIVVRIDDSFALVVLPASRRLVLSELRELLQAPLVRLAGEAEIRGLFPDCELGAMPPFGNLYGLPVYVAGSIAKQAEIAFNAGTHTEAIVMDYADFDGLVHPTVLEFITT